MNDEVVVKIADLGFARTLKENEVAGTFCGTPLTMAPEVINKEKYSNKADVWSVGCLYF